MLLANHYQNAYVTRDIEKALDIFRERCGVVDPRYFQAEVEVTTPNGKGVAVNKVALVTVGASGIGAAIAMVSAGLGAAVLYFAAPAPRPVTHQILAVDGGFSVT